VGVSHLAVDSSAFRRGLVAAELIENARLLGPRRDDDRIGGDLAR